MVKLIADCVEVCAQPSDGFGARVGVRETVRHERVDARFDQRIELLVDVGINRSRRAEWKAKQPAHAWSQMEAHQRRLMTSSCERQVRWSARRSGRRAARIQRA